ncbi:hypothetical protein SAMN03097699_3089 [Flavobacteriaceae bacterium MAR_2010_188]|nr:hypothetical protein SAMN03097699_3089 [Flavobacteriaceae bacterium MAR_2010_188]
MKEQSRTPYQEFNIAVYHSFASKIDMDSLLFVI